MGRSARARAGAGVRVGLFVCVCLCRERPPCEGFSFGDSRGFRGKMCVFPSVPRAPCGAMARQGSVLSGFSKFYQKKGKTPKKGWPTHPFEFSTNREGLVISGEDRVAAFFV